MNIIDVCLSPLFIDRFDLEKKVVVVIDVLRATSTISTALEHGVKKVIPVETIEQCKDYNSSEFILAAERDGKKVDGFEYGNSPFDYVQETIQGKSLVLTTTNGTRAITSSKNAASIITGAFLNLNAVVDTLRSQQKDVLLYCAGWKDQYSLEDTLLAGAVISKLDNEFEVKSDLAFSAKNLYHSSKSDLLGTIKNGSHFKRLQNLGIQKDLEFCVQIDEFDKVPTWNEDGLTV